MLGDTALPSHLWKALTHAIEINDIDLCKSLVLDTDLKSYLSRMLHESGDNCTLFIYALDRGRVEIAEFLAANGVALVGQACEKLSIRNRGFTPFHYCAAFGYSNIMKILLERVPEMLQWDTSVHPLHVASKYANTEFIRIMLDHLCSAEDKTRDFHEANIQVSKLVTKGTETSSGLVQNELNSGNIRSRVFSLDSLLNRQIQPDRYRHSEFDFTSFRIGDTALHLAITSEAVDAARLLLNAGANVNGLNSILETPLHLAVKSQDSANTKLLLSYGADSCAYDYFLNTPAMNAAYEGRMENLQILMTEQADLSAKDVEGRTALTLAFFKREATEVFAFLHSIKPLSQSDISAWILQSRFVAMQKELQTYILNSDMDISISESLYGSILHDIWTQDSSSLIQRVLKKITKSRLPELLNFKPRHRSTPLYGAACGGACNVMDMFLAHGADLEVEGGEHGTPLMVAAVAGRVQVVKWLVGKGAQICYFSRKSNTLVSAVTKARRYPEIVRWLLVGQFTTLRFIEL